MSDDKKPESKAPAAPVLKSIRFREEVILHKINPYKHVDLGSGAEAMVVGSSVFVRVTEAPEVVEVPRVACVLRWTVAPSMPLEEAVKLIGGGKR